MKQILLTGASGGIGRAIALRLANDGHRLILVARDRDRLRQLCEELPCEHSIISLDLSQPAAGRALADNLAAQGLHIDVVVNSAGTNALQTFERSTWDAIERQLQLNLLAPMSVVHALLPGLARGSHIINIGSVLGEIGYPGYVAYGAAKGGLKRFSEALGRELRDRGIHVSYLAPRATDTPLNGPDVVALNQALGNRVDAPAVVARAVAKLIRHPRPSRVLGFPESLFTRLNVLLPRLVDNAVGKQLPVIKAHIKETP